MSALSAYIDTIDAEIRRGLSGTNKLNGLCTRGQRGEESIIYDVQRNEVKYDDSYDHYLYHIAGSEPADAIQERGKKNTYRMSASVSLICFSTEEWFKDHVVSSLANLKDVDVESVDNDTLRVFRNELGNGYSHIEIYAFIINYRASYTINSCLKDTCHEC